MQNHRRIGRVLAVVFVLVFALSGLAIAADAAKVNINTASVEELTQLKRVGQKYAEKIVAFREANGPFKSADELVNVPGIGVKTIEANRDVITTE
jgi:competence protein ComEA